MRLGNPRCVDDDACLPAGLLRKPSIADNVLADCPLDRGSADEALVRRRVPIALNDDRLAVIRDALDQAQGRSDTA